MYSFKKDGETLAETINRMKELGERREKDTKLRKEMLGTNHKFAYQKALNKKKK